MLQLKIGKFQFLCQQIQRIIAQAFENYTFEINCACRVFCTYVAYVNNQTVLPISNSNSIYEMNNYQNHSNWTTFELNDRRSYAITWPHNKNAPALEAKGTTYSNVMNYKTFFFLLPILFKQTFFLPGRFSSENEQKLYISNTCCIKRLLFFWACNQMKWVTKQTKFCL